ncbi:class I SAM-dependent methyltransferase [Sphingomonas sp.]|uniref:class I SAM-dependent methyltransferase n=1 Tax=Sphingomonas sp. TaxID=28214 RepID=UPI002DD63AB1|nr:class I SAM-dependent methyltransferase [Sphingomonas sp.]
MTDLTDVETHFEFGKNWADYARQITEEEVADAQAGLASLVPADRIAGASFLDIGSGSGLHSLAAARLGASSITAVDIDPDSVATTRSVLARFGVEADVRQSSVFDIASLGRTFDIVYSWGVLHHTGAMWRAIDEASKMVADNGLFAIALYKKTPACGLWKVEKRLYTAAPEFIRKTARAGLGGAILASHAIRGRSPRSHVSGHVGRGMKFWTDIHDWLGGYPYESCSLAEIDEFMAARGFTRESANVVKTHAFGIFGTGCSEFLYRRH